MIIYLVTGGAGFIGSNIVEELLKRGQKVRVLDNFSTGKRENILPFLGRIELIEGDIRNYRVVREAVEGVDFILHQAALPSVPRSIKDPITTNEVNVGGTLNLLNVAKNAGVKRIVYASSSSVYGNSEILPKKEDMIPEPISPYAVSKLAGEKYCKVFYEVYGIETVILRYFNVFGPRQDPTSQYSGVIAKFINAFLNNKPLTVYGDGEQSRDFTFVDDVVKANLLVANCSLNHFGELFNVARGKRVTLNKMIKILKGIFGRDSKVIYVNPRSGDVKHSEADVSEIRERLNFTAKTSFKNGLRKTVERYRRRFGEI
jgi:UDP-glucose 4-epimerase